MLPTNLEGIQPTFASLPLCLDTLFVILWFEYSLLTPPNDGQDSCPTLQTIFSKHSLNHLMKNAIQSLDRYTNWIIGALLVGVCVLYFSKIQNSGPRIEPSTDAEFQEVVTKETRPVLVKFGAAWCPPCRSTDTALAEYEDTSSGDVKVLVLDVESNFALSQRFRVSSIPHLLIFYKGKVVDKRVGGMDTEEIRRWLKSNEKHWKN
jgi:thioredoxin